MSPAGMAGLAAFLWGSLVCFLLWAVPHRGRAGAAAEAAALAGSAGLQAEVRGPRPRQRREPRPPGRGGWLDRLLAESGVGLAPRDVVAVCALLAGAGVAAGAALAGPGAAAAASAARAAAPLAALSRRRAARLRQAERELERALQSMVAALRAGKTVRQALAAAAAGCQGLLGEELDRAAAEAGLGAAPEAALAAAAERVRVPGFEAAAAAVEATAVSGGDLASVLEGVARALADAREAEAEVTAQTAGVRSGARVISLVPAALVALMTLSSPDYFGPFFTSPAGKLLLGGSLAANLAGWILLARLTRFRY